MYHIDFTFLRVHVVQSYRLRLYGSKLHLLCRESCTYRVTLTTQQSHMKAVKSKVIANWHGFYKYT